EVLADPAKRKRYDEIGPDFARYANAGNGAPGGFQWSYTTNRPGDFGAGDFSDFFRTLFGDAEGTSGTFTAEDLFGRAANAGRRRPADGASGRAGRSDAGGGGHRADAQGPRLAAHPARDAERPDDPARGAGDAARRRRRRRPVRHGEGRAADEAE